MSQLSSMFFIGGFAAFAQKSNNNALVAPKTLSELKAMMSKSENATIVSEVKETKNKPTPVLKTFNTIGEIKAYMQTQKAVIKTKSNSNSNGNLIKPKTVAELKQLIAKQQ